MQTKLVDEISGLVCQWFGLSVVWFVSYRDLVLVNTAAAWDTSSHLSSYWVTLETIRTEASWWWSTCWWLVTSSKRSGGNVAVSLLSCLDIIIFVGHWFKVLVLNCHTMRITPPPQSSSSHWVHLKVTTRLTDRQPSTFSLKLCHLKFVLVTKLICVFGGQGKSRDDCTTNNKAKLGQRFWLIWSIFQLCVEHQ